MNNEYNTYTQFYKNFPARNRSTSPIINFITKKQEEVQHSRPQCPKGRNSGGQPADGEEKCKEGGHS
jgi:hypothetical protein